MALNHGRSISRLYYGEKFIADVAIYPQTRQLPFKPSHELRVSSFSPASDRCMPLIVLHTVSTEGVLFKLEPLEFPGSADSSKLEVMHSACIKERKTGVIPLEGGTEVHLVAMNDNRKQRPCFWGFLMATQVYKSCLTMLNLRSLALVFDLDETLIVANTLRSFEVRIEAIGSKMKAETDTHKLFGMSSELKRYMQDRVLLKQFVEDNHVWDNAVEKYVSAQVEVVPPLTEDGISLMRPVVRLQDSSMVFTRIDPKISDTSVLVRLRPAWEDLRSYLTAKGRKRFEVFVCTMAEKEYAYEMWRLLDPEGQLISNRQVIERITCVKSGSKKSLLNVFSKVNCHPKMAMVIDDRLDVWEIADQPNVHVVPAFAPYYAPQAEMNNTPPTLCVARNIACNVRASFFRDLDEGLLKSMADVNFTRDVCMLPQPPSISNYLIAEEDANLPVELSDGNKHHPDHVVTDDVIDARRAQDEGNNLTEPLSSTAEDEAQKTAVRPPLQPNCTKAARRPSPEHQMDKQPKFPNLQKESMCMPASNMFEPSQRSLPSTDEVILESELDLDIHRRRLILQHGHDAHENPHGGSMDPPFSLRSPSPSRGSPQSHPFDSHWLEGMDPRHPLPNIWEHDRLTLGKRQVPLPPFFGGSELLSAEGCAPYMTRMSNDAVHPNPREHLMNVGLSSSNPLNCLQEMSQKYNMKLEFKSELNATKDLEFSVVVFCDGEYGGEGVGRTKREAKNRAAEKALKYLRGKIMSQQPPSMFGGLGSPYHIEDPHVSQRNNRDPQFPGAGLGPYVANDVASDPWSFDKPLNFPASIRAPNPVAALKDYCTVEGITLAFKDLSLPTPYNHPTMEFACQVEVGGRVMGNGRGWTWEEAKQLAAEDALNRLRPAMPLPMPQLRRPFRRAMSPSLTFNKRTRTRL